MHDIRALRADPAAYDAGWALRGLTPQTPAILDLDRRLRAAQTALQEAQSRRNDASKLIGQAKARKDEAEAQRLMAEVEALKGEMTAQGEAEKALSAELDAVLAALPNLPARDVPHGADEHGNVEQRRWGSARIIRAPQDHVALGEGLGLMDFEAAARVSGARFVFLKGALARLERALGAFMLDLQTREHGYTEVSPPLLVRDEALYGTGQLPKFAEDLFHTTDGRWLIPTAEVSLTNMVMGQIVEQGELPLRLTALTPSFRSEAGASGRDTRGMIRQHQFYKVELVSITTPEQSEIEHERMTECAEAVLKRLELPFRTMLLCTGDMGFGARKTYDLEVWMPSQETYREISSCSNCGDFQARRMDARCKVAGEKGTRHMHTLNGSGLAVGRTLVAVLENYQDEHGRIAIPSALQPYMGGATHIGDAG
ncbi:MAG TPA: serine--tRNA ligase [Caulobacteraceae bacterium]|nr:serine--tRNA ligase [Caulobacteraceae bacterium]